jgi:Zn-finger nucleic acid-binding protein
VFLDQVAIQRVVTDRKQARAESLLGALPKTQIATAPPPATKMYIKCPCCRVVMNRRQFAAGSGVIVDVCKKHGTFFDAGELPAIVDFVMQGGLEKAERNELQRLRDQAKREQAAAVATHHAVVVEHDARSSALVDLLFALLG